MFSFEKIEKVIICVLILTLLIGVSVNLYLKTRPRGDITISRFDEAYPDDNIVKAGKRDLVNINKADAIGIMKLDGFGKVLSSRVVEYRRHNGFFVSKEEIKKVKGVGDSLYSKIKDRISLE